MKFSIKDFFSKFDHLYTFTKEILNGKPNFLFSVTMADALLKAYSKLNFDLLIKNCYEMPSKMLHLEINDP